MAWPTEAGSLRAAPARTVTRPPPPARARVIRPGSGVRRHGAELRGAWRIFAAATYRLYRRLGSPPEPGDTPWATSATLPTTPGDTFADGTWYLAVSYYNGVLDSGFLPIGPRGEPYRILVVDTAAEAPAPPQPPVDVRLEQRGGGVVRVTALYAEVGPNRADQWVVAWGGGPVVWANTAVVAMPASGLAILEFDISGLADAEVLNLLVTTQRSGDSAVSVNTAVLTVTVDASGPSAVPDVRRWRGVPAG